MIDFLPHHKTEKINCVLFSEEGNQANTTCTRLEVTSYSGLFTQVFIACSTNRIQQVTNTEVRRSDEAQLAGYGLNCKDRKSAAE